jgi:hypothetical protein
MELEELLPHDRQGQGKSQQTKSAGAGKSRPGRALPRAFPGAQEVEEAVAGSSQESVGKSGHRAPPSWDRTFSRNSPAGRIPRDPIRPSTWIQRDRNAARKQRPTSRMKRPLPSA